MRKLIILFICFIILLSLTACNENEETSTNLSDDTEFSNEEIGSKNIDFEAYSSLKTAGAYNFAVSPTGELVQFTLVHPAVGLFIEDINNGATGMLQFHFTNSNDDWGTLFVDGDNGDFEASFQYLDGGLSTASGNLSIDARGEAVSFTVSNSQNFDPYDLVEIGYVINLNDINVYSLDITENIQIDEANFIGEDTSIIQDHRFIGEFYLERPDYFNLSPSSEEAFLTVDANNISFVYNGQAFSIDYILSEHEANLGEYTIKGNYNGVDVLITLSDSNPYIIIEDDMRIFLKESLYQTYLKSEGLTDERFTN